MYPMRNESDWESTLKERFETKWFIGDLRCPDCGNAMRMDTDVTCSVCDFSKTLQPPVDLRPSRPRGVTIELKTAISPVPNEVLEQVNFDPPPITYTGPPALRDSRELISEMMRSVPQNGRVVDLGCGARDQAQPIESVGYRYVGVDYSNSSADLLADAHSIPFADSTFECVFSYAVLLHLHSPFLAIREIERVLSPGGLFVGTASQGEPFQASYFHHTAWGLVSLAQSTTTLQLSRLWCGPGTLRSLATTGRYPRVIKMLLAAVDRTDVWAPWLAPRRQTWSRRERQLDAIHRAGSIGFAMKKVSRRAPAS
jgi:SAM-dependent methyltransferase